MDNIDNCWQLFLVVTVVTQVLVQGRLNAMDITIRIGQMGIISKQSWHRVRQTIGQIIYCSLGNTTPEGATF